MRPYGINHREHARLYDVIIRDVGKFTSVVDEQTPGNDDDTMIINTGHTL